jgi:hypothetical protein
MSAALIVILAIIGGIIYQTPTSVISGTSQPSNMSTSLNQSASLGIINGGTISATGSTASCATGYGYLMLGTYPADYLKYVEFINYKFSENEIFLKPYN